MEKRVFERIPAFLSAELSYNDYFHDASIINLSQSGIYFIAVAYFSSGLNIDISIPLESTKLKIPFKIVRISETGIKHFFGFGAELLSPSQEYIKFIHDRLTLIIRNVIR